MVQNVAPHLSSYVRHDDFSALFMALICLATGWQIKFRFLPVIYKFVTAKTCSNPSILRHRVRDSLCSALLQDSETEN